MTRSLRIGLGFALVLVMVFLLVPIVAVFVAAGPGELWSALGRDVVRDALLISLETNIIAQALVLLIGTPAAYLIARGVPLRPVVVGLVELPLVLPPVVAGLGLLFAFRGDGPLGVLLEGVGWQIPLTQAAVIMAVAYVSCPFYIRAAVSAFAAVDREVVDAARTLGAGPLRTFRRIVVPLSAGGLAAGATLSMARGLGEFGATLMFAGSLQGSTQTLPLAVYAEIDSRDQAAALAIGAVLILVSAVLLIGSKLVPKWQP